MTTAHPRPTHPLPESITDLRMLVVGGGLMGHSIAGVFARHGATVTIYEENAAVRETILDRITAQSEAEGLDPAATLASLRTADRFEDAASEVHLVIEAVTEDLTVKQELFARLGDALPDAVLASNSSAFRPTDIAAHTTRPARVLGTHWFNPPHLIPIVEVVQGEQTAYEYVGWIIHLLEQAGKMPVHVRRDVPGFIGNRLQHALWREAIHLVELGVCDAETIDKVVRNSFGVRLATMGPMENADYVGLDLVLSVHRTLFPSLAADIEPSPILRENVERGRLGAKTGAGFTQWPPGRREAVAARLDAYLRESLGRSDAGEG